MQRQHQQQPYKWGRCEPIHIGINDDITTDDDDDDDSSLEFSFHTKSLQQTPDTWVLLDYQ